MSAPSARLSVVSPERSPRPYSEETMGCARLLGGGGRSCRRMTSGGGGGGPRRPRIVQKRRGGRRDEGRGSGAGGALRGAPGGPEERPVRSFVNIRAGKWTREMEANFRYHAQVLGYPVKPFEWPDGEVW